MTRPKPASETAPIAVFRLPLECCPTSNEWGRSANAVGWRRAKLKADCWGHMRGQYIKQFRRMPPVPLDSNPLARYCARVVCTRRSSREPDFGAWCKVAVDLLQVPRANRKLGLSLIWDDSPKNCEIEQRWEYAPPGRGEVVIEVWP